MVHNIKSFFDIIKKINFILSKKNKNHLVGIVVVMIIGAAFELLGVTAILPFIQIMLTPELVLKDMRLHGIIEFMNIQTSIQLIGWMGLGLIFIYLVKNIYMIFSYYVQYSFSTSVQKELSVRMLRAYMKQPYTFFLKTNSAEILRGCNNDTEGVFIILSNLYTIFAEMIAVIAIVAFIIVTEPMIAFGVIFLMFSVMAGIVFGFKPLMKKLGKKNMVAQAEKNKAINQSINGIKELFVMQRKEIFIDEYAQAADGVRVARKNYEFVSASPERIIEGICVSGLIGVVVFRVMVGVDAVSFIPKLGVFAMAAFKILPSIGKITSRMTGIVYFSPVLDNVYKNLENANEFVVDDDTTFNKLEPKMEFNELIQIKDVVWKYEEQNSNVLEGVSINIKKGESVALIGASGSGKTTLSDIILGLLQPQRGGVYVDGRDIFEKPKEWANIVGYVPQSVFLMDDSIKNNITFGIKEATDDEIWKVLEKAQLKNFVEKLPNGLRTIVGERGIKFSGGQRQRIAIARALFTNPQVLVLDEATAALDNDTENAVMEAIDALQGEVTLIIVAHRLSTIKNCDKIYEICNGQAFLRSKSEVLENV